MFMVNSEPLSLAKAKRDGLRMAKLPLDRHLDWGAGSGKSLTLNQVVSILLDAKRTGDWAHALRHVPRRKLVTHNPEAAAQKFKNRYSYLKEPSNSRWKPSRNQEFGNPSSRRKELNPKDRTQFRDIKSLFND